MRVITARKAAGLSQQELAERAGLSQRLVSHIETGAREGSLNSYTQLAKALGCAVSYLVGEQVGQNSQAGGREHVLSDPHAPPGLKALVSPRSSAPRRRSATRMWPAPIWR